MGGVKYEGEQDVLKQKERILYYYIGLWGIMAFGLFIFQWLELPPVFKGKVVSLFPDLQKNIGYGSLLLALTILVVILKKNNDNVQLMARVLTVFSSLLGLEHFRMALSSEESVIHWIGFYENFILGTCLGVFCIFFASRTGGLTENLK